MTAATSSLGLLHEDHPWLGEVVQDALHGRVGKLIAVCPEPSAKAKRTLEPIPGGGPPVAWLRPTNGGGVEWATPIEHIALAEETE